MALNGVCRKRPRSESEDCEDCLPISKRINKLHIETNRRNQEESRVFSEEISPGNCDPQLSPWQQAQIANQNQVCDQSGLSNSGQNQNCVAGPSNYQVPPLDTHPESSCNNTVLLHSPNDSLESEHGLVNMGDLQGYDPELKKEENPYYFQANSMLYDAHLLRVTRTKSFHPGDS